jgi:hypothetical protein
MPLILPRFDGGGKCGIDYPNQRKAIYVSCNNRSHGSGERSRVSTVLHRASIATNCIRAFRGGPAGYRRCRTGVKARRGHHASRADLELAWCVSTYRGANAFNHASRPHSMARVVRRHHIRVIRVSAPQVSSGADTRCSLLSGSHFSQNRPRVLKKSLKEHPNDAYYEHPHR